MDFGIYTIPRLVKREDDDYDRRNAISNIHKRIFELGYKELDLGGATEEKFKEFIWGHKIYGIDGKVDKLGKKDRKSTRLNSSHVRISYAVFCLKKKIKKEK